ncbi:protein transporter Sec31, partial [Streptomyces sp. NPDC051704]
MKFINEIRHQLVDRTIDGTTNQVSEPYTVRVPKVPVDKDRLALIGVGGLVLALTLVAIVWSTYSIGQLLGGGPGYAAGTVFDVAWLSVLLLEWLARFDPAKREFPRKVGWALALVASGAIFLEGQLAGGWQMALVGAAVSIVAKVLWWAVFKHIDKDLSPADSQWVAAEMSKANAKLAIAGVR